MLEEVHSTGAELVDLPCTDRPLKVVMGKAGDAPAMLDVAKLLSTRMLITAGSGGGKSWSLRRLLEQTHDMVQQIIFDPEGELVTLAERFDYTVCAPDNADAPLTPGAGAAAARFIYHSGRSAILSLSEFDLEDMHDFVADFCRELLRMPQESWHHVMIVFDEAQLFAPQVDKASSKKALIDLARRARKRGLCPVCAKPRLSELSKGVVGQLENKLIGLTTLDLDIDRAAEMLGMRATNARAILRRLDRGTFLAWGPAVRYDLAQVQVGPVVSRHAILGAFTGQRPQPSMSHGDLAASLRGTVGETPAAGAAADGGTALAVTVGIEDRRAPAFRRQVVEHAEAHGVDSASEAFSVGRSTIYRWKRTVAVGVLDRPLSQPRRHRLTQRGRPPRLNALAPAQRLDRLFGTALAVIDGASFSEVADGHGVKPLAVRRWVETALAMVKPGRRNLPLGTTDLARLRADGERLSAALRTAWHRETRRVSAEGLP